MGFVGVLAWGRVWGGGVWGKGSCRTILTVAARMVRWLLLLLRWKTWRAAAAAAAVVVLRGAPASM